MLAKNNKIKKKKDFEDIFKKAKSLRNNFVILKIAKNNLGLNRFGFVVSLKVSKQATERNKIRRRLAAIIKNVGGNINIGTDLVLIALPAINKMSFSELNQSLIESLERAGLLIKNKTNV